MVINRLIHSHTKIYVHTHMKPQSSHCSSSFIHTHTQQCSNSNRLNMFLCIMVQNWLELTWLAWVDVKCSIIPEKSSTHLKKLQIMGQELGQIDINNGSQQQGVFILLWKCELQSNKSTKKYKEGTERREKCKFRAENMRHKHSENPLA